MADAPKQNTTQLAEIISTQCQSWIDAIGGVNNLHRNVIFRGIQDPLEHNKLWRVKTVRDDRQPIGVAQRWPQFVTIWNQYIKEAGKTANRTNSIMVTGNIEMTREFGSSCVVIPMGAFNYTWVEDMPDVNYWWVDQTVTTEIERFKHGKAEFPIMGDDGTLQSAIISGNEIMLRPKDKKYLVIDIAAYREAVEILSHRALSNSHTPTVEALSFPTLRALITSAPTLEGFTWLVEDRADFIASSMGVEN